MKLETLQGEVEEGIAAGLGPEEAVIDVLSDLTDAELEEVLARDNIVTAEEPYTAIRALLLASATPAPVAITSPRMATDTTSEMPGVPELRALRQRLFAARDYGEAIDIYSEALVVMAAAMKDITEVPEVIAVEHEITQLNLALTRRSSMMRKFSVPGILMAWIDEHYADWTMRNPSWLAQRLADEFPFLGMNADAMLPLLIEHFNG